MMHGSSDLHPPGAALLRVGNASIWLATGLLVLAPSYRAIGEAQLDALGLPHLLMWVTCAGEVVLALVIATRAPGWLFTLLPTTMIAAFTLILALHDPLLLAHPLGVLSKNLPVLALIWVSFEVHRSGWTPRATRWLRVGMAIVWITEGLFPKLLFQQAWEVELVGSYVRPIDPATFLRVVGALQIVSGVLALTLRGNWLRALLAGQFVALLVLPTLVGLREPHWLTHPFGPLTKNLPILAGTALALARVPSSPFFRAEWRRVCMFHFRVPRALAARHLPSGVELDERDGSAWASFVSLEFERTRVLGIAVPWHTRFGDVNLRLYVRRGADRGVVFIREIVPLALAAFVARAIFREPFVAMPMSFTTDTRADGSLHIARSIGRGARAHRLTLETSAAAAVPSDDSEAHFFKERYLAFGASGAHLRIIRVEHPRWAVREVVAATLDVDFRALYGEDWGAALLSGPASRTFVEGSEVELYWPVVVSPAKRHDQP